MTVAEAIEYWEGLRKTFSSQLEKEENPFGRMHLQTTIDVLDTTISALRAQQQPNAPLTLDELKGMDGEPVWIQDVGDHKWYGDGWAIVCREYCLARKASNGNPAFFERYGKTWIAYRRKPEEGTV